MCGSACIYASLILADDNISITAEKISTLLSAAEVEVDSIWPSLFARALSGENVRSLILESVGVGGGAGAPGAAPAAGAEAQEDAAVSKAEEKEAERSDSEESDFGMD